MVVNDATKIPDLEKVLLYPYESFQPAPILPMTGITTYSVIHDFYYFSANELMFGRMKHKQFEYEGGEMRLEPYTYDAFRGGQVFSLYALLETCDEVGYEFQEKFFGCYGPFLHDERVPDENLLKLCDEISHFLLGFRPEIYDLSDQKDLIDSLVVAQTMASRIVYDRILPEFPPTRVMEKPEEFFEAFISNYLRENRAKAQRSGDKDYFNEVANRCKLARKQVDLLLAPEAPEGY